MHPADNAVDAGTLISRFCHASGLPVFITFHFRPPHEIFGRAWDIREWRESSLPRFSGPTDVRDLAIASVLRVQFARYPRVSCYDYIHAQRCGQQEQIKSIQPWELTVGPTPQIIGVATLLTLSLLFM